MKILVVGGAGYVGGHLVNSLLRAGHDVRVIDKLIYDDLFLKPVPFKNVDINNFDELNSHFDWAEVVVWLAALVGDSACSLNPNLTLKTNVESVRYLVTNFKKRVIFLSTCSVYGAQDGILDELSNLNPLSLYAESKIQAEEIIQTNSDNYLIFRLGTLYGISDTYSRLRADLVVNILTMRAFFNKQIEVFGGPQYRPLLHVKDVGSLISNSINSTKSGIYNLHSENLNILEIAEKVCDQVKNVVLQKTDISFQDARNYKVSSEKAIKDLGFTPSLLVTDGIREILELVSDGRIPDVNNPRFSNANALERFIRIAKF